MAKQWQENSVINFMKRFHQSIFLQVFREFCDQIGVENIRYACRFKSSFYTENVTNLTLLCSLLEMISLSSLWNVIPVLYNVVGNEINRRKWGFIFKPGRMGIMVIEVFNPSYGYIKSQGPLKSNSRCSIIKNIENNDSPLFLAWNHLHRTEPVTDIVFLSFQGNMKKDNWGPSKRELNAVWSFLTRSPA